MKASLLVMVAAVLLVPVPARGDGYVNPWIGINLLDSTDSGRTAFGVTAGYMGGGVFGFEGDFGYSPEIFGSRVDLGDNTAIELMGNFILGVPIGGTHGAGVRPFVSGGLGVMRTNIDAGPIFREPQTNTEFGYNLGAGMMGFFNQHVGVRGDVRYLGTLRDVNRSLGHGLEEGRLRHWRLSGGVTFR